MAIDFPQIDYVSRDYASFKQDMIDLIPIHVPEWTNLTESDFGIVLIELFAHTADSLAYYQDRQANEAFITTAQLRKSIIDLSKLIDYQLSGATPASAQLSLTIDPDPLDRVLAVGTKWSTEAAGVEDAVFFELLTATLVPALAIALDVDVVEGESQSEAIGVSTGLPSQLFPLSQTPVIQPSVSNPDTIIISVDEGSGFVVWTRTDNIIGELSTAQVWYFEVDENDIITIRFGDGTTGKIPAINADIKAEYRKGGGERGIVGAGTITLPVSVPTYVTASTNPASSSGGEDRETIEHARVFGPASLRRQNRAVTEEDYKTLAETFPGVLLAGVSTVVTLLIANVNIHVLPTGGGVATQQLLDDLKDFIDTVKVATTQVLTFPADLPLVDISVDINAIPTFTNAAVDSIVNSTIAAFFTPGELAFGQRVNLGDIYKLIEDVDGVNYSNISKLTLVPVIRTVVATGDASIANVLPTAAITEETWTIDFTSPTAFTVTGSVSGLQVNTGTLDNSYANDAATLSFIINAGGSPMVLGDKFTIRTSLNLGNILFDSTEIATLGVVTLNVTGGV